MNVALSYINEDTIKIKVIFEDGMANPNNSISAFRKLRNEDIKVIVTILSPICLALKPLAEKEGVILFANGSHPDITKGKSPFIFRHSQTASQEASLLTHHIIDDLKAKKVSILAINNDYGVAFKEEIKKNLSKTPDVEVVSDILFEKDEVEFRGITQKLLEPKPECIVIIGPGKGPGIAMKRLKEYDYPGLIVTGLLTPDAFTAAGDAAIGIYHTQFDFDYEDAKFKQINEMYKERYNRDMPPLALFGFNTLLLIKEAIEEVGYSPLNISKFLRGLKTFQGIGERMQISNAGDVMPSLKIVKREEGM
jgi:branched-chain amino acid transport system substrate-binding protein